jgi:hypothetical protein
MSEWKPIETAPRDGTMFLACIEHGKRMSTIIAKWVSKGYFDVDAESCVGWLPGHTHKAYWMPLPPPPESNT